jgi:hypothetical protein
MTIFRTQSTSSNPLSEVLFPALPLELREMIYHHAILPHASPTQPHRVIVSACDAVHNTDPRYPIYLPSLCRVNRATRIEVGVWYIRNTEFGMLWPQYLVHLSQFLSNWPDSAGFAAVRRLDFEAFGRHIPPVIGGVRKNEYIEFMKKCRGLRGVRIKFEITYVVSEPVRQTSRSPHQLCAPLLSQRIMAPRKASRTTLNKADIQLALTSLNTSQLQSTRRAAIIFNVLKSTLIDRRASIPAQRDYQPNSKKLNQREEEVIIRHILNLDIRRFAPTYKAVRDIADKLLAARSASQVRQK